jgi:hypothetical protein
MPGFVNETRKKHPVRGRRQSAASHRETRDGTIQGFKEEAYVEDILPDCRPLGVAAVVGCRFSRIKEKGNRFSGHEKKFERMAPSGATAFEHLGLEELANCLAPRFLHPLTARVGGLSSPQPIKIHPKVTADRTCSATTTANPRDHRITSQDGPQEARSRSAGEHLPGPPGPGG